MDRDCNKCVYHTSGSCSQWECKGTTPIDDIRAEEKIILGMFINAKTKAECRIDGRYEIQFDVPVLDRMIELVQKAIQYDENMKGGKKCKE